MNRKSCRTVVLIFFMVLVLSACTKEELLIDEIQFVTEDDVSENNFDGTSGVDNPEMDTAEVLFVHICGAVSSPGVYSLPLGSRINDAVMLAGGFDSEADCEAVNLVELLEDGQQIRIPFIGEENYNIGTGLIDINSADKDMLCQIPGIGESRAEAIIKYRESIGGFQSPEELMQVPGIKEGIYARVSSYIECR